MDAYVNRFRRFENPQSSGYDFLISSPTIWDNKVKQTLNLLITQGTTRRVSFLVPINNDYDNKFITFGTINPDTQGQFDRNGRLNYWVDFAMIDKLPAPPFAVDISLSSDYISDFINQIELSEIPLDYNQSDLIVRKLASPTLLKLHNNTGFAEKCLSGIADYYLYKNKKLVIVLDDNDYDNAAVAVCKAIFENAPISKNVFYISYSNDINRLCYNSDCNLFCCPASERENIPQDDSLLVIDLVDGYISDSVIKNQYSVSQILIKNLIKCGLMADFNLFVQDHLYDPLVNKLYHLKTLKAVTSLAYLYSNFRGLTKLRPNKSSEDLILDFIHKLN